MSNTKDLVAKILGSRKYRDLHLPEETIRDLIEHESQRYQDPRSIEDSVRKKLHQITALYLGDPDYAQAMQQLEDIHERSGLTAFAQQMLETHTSTRERLPYLRDFYHAIFEKVGMPASILDLACGLNPFALPAMQLPAQTTYRAYDIHLPRVKLINAFVEKWGEGNLNAEQRDILTDPPQQKADVAFFFKEAHRMDARRKGSNRILWDALQVNTLLVSLPRTNIRASHDISQRMQQLVADTLQDRPWAQEIMLFEDEMVFIIHKGKN